MIDRVISGGQLGADIGSLRATRASSIPTGGWAARGWLIEGPGGKGNVSAPWLANWGLTECPEGESPGQRYAIRRRWNVRDSNGTVLFFRDWTPGTIGVLNDLEAARKPCCVVVNRPDALGMWNPAADYLTEFGWVARADKPEDVVEWVGEKGVRVLNAAGPRASKAPKVEWFAESYLTEVFRLLARGGE